MIPLIYDQINVFSKDRLFYNSLLNNLNVSTIADVGCGTGRLTKSFAESGINITAIDPNGEAIHVAKTKIDANNISWIVGDSTDLESNSYDAVIMTANVAQVFLTEASWQQLITDVYRALKPGGSFIFDCRNAAVKVWESWKKDLTPDYATNEKTGEKLEIWTTYDGFINDIYTFYETVQVQDTNEIVTKLKLELKFRTKEELEHSIQTTGFTIDRIYGDFEFTDATNDTYTFIFHCKK